VTVSVKLSKVDDLVADKDFTALLEKYADELVLEGLPRPSAQIETYRKLELAGILQPIAAYDDDKVIGFVNVLISENPHYGICIALTESFFVLKEYRKTGAGTFLRREAEMYAQRKGSPAIFISAPCGGTLAKCLESSKGYKESNRTFFKRLCDA